MSYGEIYKSTWWGNRVDGGFGTAYPFLLNQYSGAAAAYSLRQLSSDNLNVVRVRRDSDNAEQDFNATEITDGTLETWVNAYNNKLPLDQSTGASAAYSLRNLSNLYNDPVVRVRRNSDNTEQDFNATEVIDGTLETFVGVGNNGYVTTWYDQSGNGNDATQTTAASQPKIVDNGLLVEENGRPGVDFDGVDDYLQPDNNLYTNDISVFLVIENNELNTSNYCRFLYLADGINSFQLVRGDSSDSFFLMSKNTSFQTANEAFKYSSINNQKLISTITSTIDTDAYINSELVVNVSNDSLGSGNNNISLIGVRDDFQSSTYYGGTIQEIIIYPSDQSTNRVNIEGNINKYYDIYTGNGYVSTWYDQSGNGNDATQATAAEQPKIVDAGVLVEENGRPAVSFDGTDDELSYSITNTNAVSVFLIQKNLSVLSGNRYYVAYRKGANTWGVSLSQPSNQGFLIYQSDTTSIFASGISSGITDQNLLSAIANGVDTITLHENGTLLDSDTYDGTLNTTSTGGNIGTNSSSYSNSLIQEIIIYPSDESANRVGIETNINNFYNIYS